VPALHVSFDEVRDAARANALVLCRRLLPKGRLQGREYVALNPNRADRRLGSFKINISTGAWADFADGVGGRDLIGLVAYLRGTDRLHAARLLASALGLSGAAPRH
jgi:hypothetical protein